MFVKSLHIVGGLAALLVSAQVHAAIVFQDEFTGTAGTPANPSDWTFTGTGDGAVDTHTGLGTLGLDNPEGGSAQLMSTQAFAPGAGQVMTASWIFSMNPGNGFIGLYDGGLNAVIVYENGNILTTNGGQVGNVGGQINLSELHTFTIEWSASKLSISFDGSEKYSTTDPSLIPDTNIPIELFALRYGSAGRTELYTATVDISPIPEPAMLGTLGLGGMMLMRRRWR